MQFKKCLDSCGRKLKRSTHTNPDIYETAYFLSGYVWTIVPFGVAGALREDPKNGCEGDYVDEA